MRSCGRFCRSERNLFIVGDDDQSIYRFRGAKPEIMLNFPKDYPDAKQIVLDRNFRSVASVIRAAQLVIRENTKRFAKRAVHVRKGQGQIDIREFSGQEHESLYLIKKGAGEFLQAGYRQMRLQRFIERIRVHVRMRSG